MKRNKCSICKNEITHIYKLSNIPLASSVTEIPLIECGDLSYSICDTCNTIQLDNLIPLNILYGKSHNFTSVGEIWKNHFLFFSEKIKDIINNKIVMEVGCPTGKIANISSNYKTWYAVEPNINVNSYKNKNINFIKEFFDDNISNHVNEKIDVILHSHLFEHIYEPNIFLKKCFELLTDDGEMFFSVPNMQFIADNSVVPFFGVFFEHTIFLNKENITYLLEKNNFKIINIYYYDNHSIFFHVKKNKKDTKINIISNINDINKFKNNISYYNEFILKCKYEISKAKNTYKNIYIFGAYYNTQILLAMGLNTINISGILDNCIEKQDKYLYGYDILIKSPNVLKNEDNIVILKNGVYSNEIYNQIVDINKNTYIINF
jgi:2-polyprenyl-3-methyl-5-hydroxy-6-metoxy-1,4-benzoquinol methylase